MPLIDVLSPESWSAAVCTTTENEELRVLPAASCAVHVTCVEPTANTLPETGSQETETLPSTRSLADGKT